MIIPVIDMKDNVCVSGKSGMRDTYQKLNSIYGDNPLTIAENLKKDGFKYLYVADLDKIEDKGDNSNIIAKINEIIPVLLDNGISNLEDAVENKKICSFNILATETIRNLQECEEIIEVIGKENIIMSIDIKDNKLLIQNNDIYIDDIISLINKCLIEQVIILNLSSIGTKNCTETTLQEKIIRQTPHTNHILAGGITNNTIKKYNKRDIKDFLVGTVLHEGNLNKNYI